MTPGATGRRRVRTAAGVVLLLTACAARAETLDEAWAAALTNDAQLKAAQSRTLAAGAAVDSAFAQKRPVLTMTSSTSRWRVTPAFDFAAVGVPLALPLFGGNSVSLAEARIAAPIYSGGAHAANVAAAAAALTGGEHAAAALAADLKLAVADAYVAVLRAASALAVADANSASLTAHAHDVEDMQRTGQVPRNDYLAAAAALADADQRKLAAANALAVARATYNRQLGRALDAAVELAPLAVPPLGPDLVALRATAVATRTELMGMDAVALELGSRATAARAARRPQVTLSGGYTFVENDVLNREDFWSVGVGVQWSPFDSGRARSAAAELAHRSAAAAHEREHLQSLIELEVTRAWYDASAARARLDVAGSAVAQADENLRVVRDRYRSGEGTNTEVLDAEALRTLTSGNLDNARYDAALAQYRLARSTGRL